MVGKGWGTPRRDRVTCVTRTLVDLLFVCATDTYWQIAFLLMSAASSPGPRVGQSFAFVHIRTIYGMGDGGSNRIDLWQSPSSVCGIEMAHTIILSSHLAPVQ